MDSGVSASQKYAPEIHSEPGVRLRAERLYQQLDLLQPVRQQARHDLLTESRKHHFVASIQSPAIGTKS